MRIQIWDKSGLVAGRVGKLDKLAEFERLLGALLGTVQSETILSQGEHGPTAPPIRHRQSRLMYIADWARCVIMEIILMFLV